MYSLPNNSYLHRASIDEKSIQVLRGLGSCARIAENNGSNTPARTILIIGKHNPLHRACRFGKVFL